MSKDKPQRTRWISSLIFLIAEAIYILFLPPKNDYWIWGFIFLTSLTVYLTSSLFLDKLYARLLTFFIIMLLSITYAIGFQLLPTFLLICFIIGLGFILKK